MFSSIRWPLWVIVLCIAAAVMVCAYVVNSPSATLFSSHQESEKRLLSNTRCVMELQKQRMGATPYRDWPEDEKEHYENICRTLRELRQPLAIV